MKKFLLIVLVSLAVLAGPLTTVSKAADGKYEGTTITATTVASTWTLLTGSTLRFSAYKMNERTFAKQLQVFGGGNTNNAAAYYYTVPAGQFDEDDIYKQTNGIYVRVTGTGDTATVELRTKRPASVWGWR
jgi:hypothetical protein